MHTTPIPVAATDTEESKLRDLKKEIDGARIKANQKVIPPSKYRLDAEDITDEFNVVINHIIDPKRKDFDNLLSERRQYAEVADIRDRLIASRQRQEARLVVPGLSITIETYITYSNSLYPDFVKFLPPQRNDLANMQTNVLISLFFGHSE